MMMRVKKKKKKKGASVPHPLLSSPLGVDWDRSLSAGAAVVHPLPWEWVHPPHFLYSPPQCPPPLRVRHYPPSSPGGQSASLGTGRRRLSGPRPQNAEVPRSGRCVCPRHTVFGLSLARVAALTPAAWTPPVAYGVRPVPAPCDLPRPRCFGPLSAAPPPRLVYHPISA